MKFPHGIENFYIENFFSPRIHFFNFSYDQSNTQFCQVNLNFEVYANWVHNSHKENQILYYRKIFW
jgi:hypothetical protein